jgi:hypothetical protein
MSSSGISSVGRLSLSISLRKDDNFGSKDERNDSQAIKRRHIGFLSRTMAHIYNPIDATVDLLGIMQLESVMEIEHCSKD